MFRFVIVSWIEHIQTDRQKSLLENEKREQKKRKDRMRHGERQPNMWVLQFVLSLLSWNNNEKNVLYFIPNWVFNLGNQISMTKSLSSSKRAKEKRERKMHKTKQENSVDKNGT